MSRTSAIPAITSPTELEKLKPTMNPTVNMFRVADQDEKDLLLADDRDLFFTTPHFNGYPAVLMRIPTLKQMSRDELRDLVVDAWMSRAQKRVAKKWLAENEPEDDLQ